MMLMLRRPVVVQGGVLRALRRPMSSGCERRRVLEAAATHVGGHGWSQEALVKGAVREKLM